MKILTMVAIVATASVAVPEYADGKPQRRVRPGAIKNATSLDEFQVLVGANGDDPVYGDFTLSINGYCFRQCDYVPFED